MKLHTPIKIVLGILAAFVIVGAVFAVRYYDRNLSGSGPAWRGPSGDIIDKLPDSSSEDIPGAVNNTDFPLKLPKGFTISIFAKNLPDARVMAMDGFGNLWVSQAGRGTISQLEIKDGKVTGQNEVFRNLNKPHGLVIDNNVLYFAEQTKITRVTLYSDDPGQKIADLPNGGRHFTRTLLLGSDGRLYVSIGSTCDVCNEKDERIATVYSMNKDGSDFKKVASGLRNSVFMANSPIDGKIWATEMGRDNLGDDLPPDEVNIISGPSTSSGQNPPDFGWPVCYGQNIHDSNFDKNQYIQDPCKDKTPSRIDLPAHSAPLGLAFIPKQGWPSDYQNDLIVAFHGSWNRSQPTGYKLARIKLDDKGNYQGMEDFISGWLASDGKTSLGRPVDVKFFGNDLYVSDDKVGVIYKVSYLSTLLSTGSLVSVSNLKENQIITSPQIVEGEAVGNWFFEASFPIRVMDANWQEIGIGIAQAQGEWMTTNKVPYKAEVTFTKSATDSGWLVLQKDNPSGLAEHDAEYHFPVKFK